MWIILQLQSLETLIIFDEEEVSSSSTTKLHKQCSLEYWGGPGSGSDWVLGRKESESLAPTFPGGRGSVFAKLIIISRALRSSTIRKPLEYVTVGYFSQGTSVGSNMVHKRAPEESAVVSLIRTHTAVWKGFHGSVSSRVLEGASLLCESLSGAFPTSKPNISS